MVRKDDVTKLAAAGLGLAILSGRGSAGNGSTDVPGTSDQPDGFPEWAYGPYLEPGRAPMWEGMRVPENVAVPQPTGHENYPEAFAITDRDAPLIEVAVHQDADMENAHGRFPQKRIARHLADAFEAHGINYVVGYGHDAYQYSEDDTTELLDRFYEWDQTLFDGDVPHQAKDCNLLLAHNGASGGGYSWGPGGDNPQASVSAAGDITSDSFARRFNHDDGYGRAVHPAMHEVMHNLGIGHANQGNSGGLTWLDDSNQRWYRSPTSGTPEDGGSYTNICGEDMGGNPNDYPTWVYAGYSNCTISNAEIH